ncbi:MAG: hypothetical protein ACLVKA_06425 [Collinsella aerofaciens]
MERPCAWKKYTPQQIEELEELCRGYKQFLSENKTERLCVKTGIKMAEEAGYVNLETVIAEGRELKAGDKVYAANHGKDLMLVNLGTPHQGRTSMLTWTRRVWTQAESRLRGRRHGLPRHALLRRRQELPLGGLARTRG